MKQLFTIMLLALWSLSFAQVNEVEPNNNFSEALTLITNGSVTGSVYQNDPDFWLFGLGSTDITLSGYPAGVTLKWYENEVYQYTITADTTINFDATKQYGFEISTNATTESYLLNFSGGVLPVELAFFKSLYLQNLGVQLTWQTASELNNQGFEVERSYNGTHWEVVGFVSGQGTSNNMTTYTFLDKKYTENFAYYRLRQIDFDGVFEYSPVIYVLTPQHNTKGNVHTMNGQYVGTYEIGNYKITNFCLFTFEGKTTVCYTVIP